MTASFDALGLSSSALPLLRDLIHDRLGLYYDNGRCDMLSDRLAPLVLDRGFESYLDYYYLLKYDAEAPSEWARVMDSLSVPETYFWREIDQIRAVSEIVLPKLVEASRGAPIRIWSIPCATGEEPLTIAMVLEQAGWFARAPIEIHASDASAAALERARQGRYRERAFRSLPPALRERWFQKDGDAWVVAPALHGRIRSWTRVNLISDAEVAAAAAEAPIVFCRNVFIYFSDAAIRRVIDRLACAMSVPGYLCVGASESLLRATTRFELEEIGGAFIYVKKT